MSAVSGPGRHDHEDGDAEEADQLGRALAGALLLGDVDIREAPVALVQVEAVAEEELVGDREADVAHGQVVDQPAVGAVEERADGDVPGSRSLSVLTT